jgi:hypothetical protein
MMRTRTLARGQSYTGGPARTALRARIEFVRERFRAEGKVVPGVNAVIKWMLKRQKGKR